MDKMKQTDWIPLDSSKLLSVRNSRESGVQSFLTPSKIPYAMRVSVVDDGQNILFEYKYEAIYSDSSEQEELEAYKAKAFNTNMLFEVGSKSKKLFRVKVPVSELEILRAATYKKLREDLDMVRQEHPRWGTFSAVSNSFAAYAKTLDNKLNINRYAY